MFNQYFRETHLCIYFKGGLFYMLFVCFVLICPFHSNISLQLCFQHSWVLYEKPYFQGRTIALEEGATELENMWAEPVLETSQHNSSPMVIGSIRLAVRVSAIITISPACPRYLHHIHLTVRNKPHYLINTQSKPSYSDLEKLDDYCGRCVIITVSCSFLCRITSSPISTCLLNQRVMAE